MLKLLHNVLKYLFEPDFEKKKADEQRLVDFYSGKRKSEQFIKSPWRQSAN